MESELVNIKAKKKESPLLLPPPNVKKNLFAFKEVVDGWLEVGMVSKGMPTFLLPKERREVLLVFLLKKIEECQGRRVKVLNWLKTLTEEDSASLVLLYQTPMAIEGLSNE